MTMRIFLEDSLCKVNYSTYIYNKYARGNYFVKHTFLCEFMKTLWKMQIEFEHFNNVQYKYISTPQKSIREESQDFEQFEIQGKKHTNFQKIPLGYEGKKRMTVYQKDSSEDEIMEMTSRDRFISLGIATVFTVDRVSHFRFLFFSHRSETKQNRNSFTSFLLRFAKLKNKFFASFHFVLLSFTSFRFNFFASFRFHFYRYRYQ